MASSLIFSSLCLHPSVSRRCLPGVVSVRVYVCVCACIYDLQVAGSISPHAALLSGSVAVGRVVPWLVVCCSGLVRECTVLFCWLFTKWFSMCVSCDDGVISPLFCLCRTPTRCHSPPYSAGTSIVKNAGSGLWYAPTVTYSSCCRAAPHDMPLLQTHFIVGDFLSEFLPYRGGLKWNHL